MKNNENCYALTAQAPLVLVHCTSIPNQAKIVTSLAGGTPSAWYCATPCVRLSTPSWSVRKDVTETGWKSQ